MMILKLCFCDDADRVFLLLMLMLMLLLWMSFRSFFLQDVMMDKFRFLYEN